MATIYPEDLPSDSGSLENLSEEDVRAQLERILTSPEFRGKPMLRGFLHFIVDRTFAGRAHQIKGYTIATQVFGRKEGFDPVQDPISLRKPRRPLPSTPTHRQRSEFWGG